MEDLKERAIRGAVAKVFAQAANFILRFGSLIVLARLLEPKDFGLVGMVTAVIGVLNLLKDFGLSTATVQRDTVSDEQISTLFWINLLVGAILALGSFAAAPILVSFYHEPRLFAVTAVMALAFIVNAIGVQHSALLQRQMRFTTLAVIETVALLVSTAVGIGMAVTGYGYWSLVGSTVSLPLTYSMSVWLVTRWIPGMPSRQVEVRSLMRFGGALTLNCMVTYLAYNFEKVLLGRFWGAETLGIYGRAYQLVSIPTDNLNSSVGGVAFSALSRLQGDPDRLRSYFLKGYSLFLALSLPVTIFSCLFAHDLIVVFLGPKWSDAIDIFRLLAPVSLALAFINPLGWLLFSMGHVGKSLKIALVMTPVVIAGYLIGMSHGAKGVALGYSTAMMAWVVPHIAWCVRDTPISFRDVMHSLSRPLVAAITATIPPIALNYFSGELFPPLPRLLLEGAVFLGTYAAILLFVMGQKPFYMDLLRGLRRTSPVAEKAVASL